MVVLETAASCSCCTGVTRTLQTAIGTCCGGTGTTAADKMDELFKVDEPSVEVVTVAVAVTVAGLEVPAPVGLTMPWYWLISGINEVTGS